MKEVNYSTQKGKELYGRTLAYEGSVLSDVYKSWSVAKEEAYNRCRRLFLATENPYGFAIVSANTFSFACSWYAEKDGEEVCYYITKDNDYLIYMDR